VKAVRKDSKVPNRLSVQEETKPPHNERQHHQITKIPLKQ
jgi:hypothetical protein